MHDLISRQGAIKAIEQLNIPEDMCVFEILSHVELAITTLPSTEHKGKWINNSPVTMKCDQCGYVIKDWRWNELNFCANCGADMRERKEERV